MLSISLGLVLQIAKAVAPFHSKAMLIPTHKNVKFLTLGFADPIFKFRDDKTLWMHCNGQRNAQIVNLSHIKFDGQTCQTSPYPKTLHIAILG